VNVPSCALSQASVASAYGLDMVWTPGGLWEY
jgi:hypothetical protein